MPETRGYHLDLARGSTPATIREEIGRAARAGFNVVLFPAYINGYTLFPSASAKGARFAPIHPHFRHWDPLAVAVEEANRVGVNVWGFARPYNLHPRYSTLAPKLLKKFPQWRIVVHPDYRRAEARIREGYSACPVNSEYRRYLGDVLTDLVIGYPVEGLVVNYTGYGFRHGPIETHPYCFCPECRQRYHEQIGGALGLDALNAKKIEEVRQWQTEASESSLAYLHHRLVKMRRTLRLVCRAQPQWRWDMDESEPDVQAQFCLDWNRMLDNGNAEELLIDHDDETAPDMFRTRLVADLARLHEEALLLPAVLAREPRDLEQPVEAVRRYPVAGFLAEFAKPLTDEDANFIREHYLAEPAQSPDHAPLLAVAFLLHRVQSNHQDNELVGDFMRDFLRLIQAQLSKGASFETLEIILQNLGGLQAAIRRGRLADAAIPESTLRDIALARRIVRLACLDVRS